MEGFWGKGWEFWGTLNSLNKTWPFVLSSFICLRPFCGLSDAFSEAEGKNSSPLLIPRSDCLRDRMYTCIFIAARMNAWYTLARTVSGELYAVSVKMICDFALTDLLCQQRYFHSPVSRINWRKWDPYCINFCRKRVFGLVHLSTVRESDKTGNSVSVLMATIYFFFHIPLFWRRE